jgi:hypothetical protein
MLANGIAAITKYFVIKTYPISSRMIARYADINDQ